MEGLGIVLNEGLSLQTHGNWLAVCLKKEMLSGI